ncbi:MAG: hypothetical protein WAK11_04655 [Candidatus Cybelea sp.]
MFECLHDAKTAPELRIEDIDRTFAPIAVVPQWTFEDPVWQTTLSIPGGHYIFESHTRRCTGESEQLVAIPGQVHHVTMTLDEKHEASAKAITVRVDENMYAAAVYGLLPSLAARVELMSGDSLVGEQTRQTAKVDGAIYEFDHLRSGLYVLRVRYGGIAVSREVVIPPNKYGATARTDLTSEDASQIVQMQAAGSHFVPVDNYMHESITAFQRGPATVDGWTNELISPSDYSIAEQRISVPATRALDTAERFIRSDAHIPKGFRNLSAWSLQVEKSGHEHEILVNLFPTNLQAWLRDGPKASQKCYIPRWKHYVGLAVNDQTWSVDETWICP